MDLKTYRNALTLMYRIFDRRKNTVPRIQNDCQKPAYGIDEPILQPFPRTTPEAQGISSDYIAEFFEALKNDDSLDMHSIMVIRNGAVIAQGNFGAYDSNMWHITHSQSKSITALAIGMLIDEGLLQLDEKIVKLFEKRASVLSQITHKNITVRNLLTMSSGIVFNEAGAITETDWIKCFFESSVKFEPGKQFSYNSMNTYMLSAIVKQVSGQGMMEYLQKRLWEPLGIKKIFWETCPKGIEKGGWGLYIRPEDIAKIAQLILQKGRWGDRQLVSESWIEEATSLKMTTPEGIGDFNYGYQIWLGRKQNSFLFNGMYGQNVLGYWDTGIIIVSNAGNNELFQQSSFFDIVGKYFSEDFRPTKSLPENPAAYKRLQSVQSKLCKDIPAKKSSWIASIFDGAGRNGLSELFCAINGKTYYVKKGDALSVGLFPLLAQTIQNNFTKGLSSISFNISNGDLTVTINENDESHELPVGFTMPSYTEVTFHGEPYKVGVKGRFATNEDNIPVLIIRISFLEISNSRFVKIFFYNDKIVMKWWENPGKDYVTGGLESLVAETKLHPVIETLVSKADNDFILYKISSSIEPEVIAWLEKKPEGKEEL